MKTIRIKPSGYILLLLIGLLVPTWLRADEFPRPKGLMLNLDFESAKDGLIPSKTLYPLFVPQGDLEIERFNNRNMLTFQYGQGIDIPHSLLLDPNGQEWIITVRAFPLTDGIILSQSNTQYGYAIYMKEGHIYATIRTGHSAVTLQEPQNQVRSKFTRRWVTIELQIKKDQAILSLNRKRVAVIRAEPTLSGDNLHIRLGNHNSLPTPFQYIKGMQPTGFTGAINSLKIIRQ